MAARLLVASVSSLLVSFQAPRSQAPALDVTRPESLPFEHVDFDGSKRLDLRASGLALSRGWSLYALRPALWATRARLVAARALDRVVRRGLLLDASTIGWVLDERGEPGGKVPDSAAARALVRVLCDGRVLGDEATGARLWQAARILARRASAEALHSERSRGIHESLHHTRVHLGKPGARSWRPRARLRADGAFDVRLHVFRAAPWPALLRVEAIVTRDGRALLRERELLSMRALHAAPAESFARDLALVRARVAAAFDVRRTRAFVDGLVEEARRSRDACLAFARVLAVMGPPDFDFGAGERVLAYRTWDAHVLEFVGDTRVRELRIAEVPRVRSLLRDDLVSGPTVHRIWSAARRD